MAFLWAFIQGPFDHIHPEGLDHDDAPPAHLHFAEVFAGGGPYLAPRTSDDDEIDVPWNAAPATVTVVYADLTLIDRVEIPEPSVEFVALLIPRPRAHDPPASSPRIPRAPPA